VDSFLSAVAVFEPLLHAVKPTEAKRKNANTVFMILIFGLMNKKNAEA
jgi:hypothetical protein